MMENKYGVITSTGSIRGKFPSSCGRNPEMLHAVSKEALDCPHCEIERLQDEIDELRRNAR